MPISISKGNSKLGAISSVSLPPVKTCRVCDCFLKCYAKKYLRIRPNVKRAYENNLNILETDPETYWREVEASIMMSRFFRFHVSGDIPDFDYLGHMVEIAKRNPHCEILCFTKKYELVNEFMDLCGEFPLNLHMILSGWVNLPCSGNCTLCATTDGGCWALKNGEQVVFDEH